MKYLSLLILLFSLNATAKEWRINWQHSKMGFEITYMGISNIDGTFNKYDGAFNYDPKTNKLSDIEVVIKTKSIDTDNSKRDQHLKKSDFFNVNKFPKIIFKSTKVTYKNDIPSKIQGILNIKGIKKTVSLDVKIKGIVNDPWDKKKKSLFLEAKTVINRSDFGITWNKTIDDGSFILSDKVAINLDIEAFESGVRPAFSRFYLPTNDIKKNIKEEVLKEKKVLRTVSSKEKVVTSNIVKETNSSKGMIYTIIFGFIFFVLMIAATIKLQLWMIKYLEKMKVDDVLCFIIPNLVTLVLLTVAAIGLAPYMGYGTHPWQ